MEAHIGITRATQSSNQLLDVKRYASILVVMWLLCIAPVLAAETIPRPSDDRIVIGFAAGYAPYSFLDENDMPTGYNVELTQAIAKVMQLDVEVRIRPWGEIRQGLENGEIDAAPMYYSVERDKLVDYSSPFSVVHNAIFIRRDAPAIETEDDLRGKDIIVISGDIMHDYVLQNGLSSNPVLAPTETDALRLLASGEHDCALMSQITGLYWAKELELTNIVTVGPLLRPSEVSFAVTEGNTALRHLLNEGLAVMEKTGAYKRIHDKWFGVLIPKGSSQGTILKYIALVAAPLLLLLAFFAIWSRSLKRQVARRTQELSESEERYRAVAEDTSVLICRFLPGGEITYVNEAYCKYFEKTAEELVAQTFLSLIPEADRETVMANISAMTVDSPNQSHEHKVVGAGGEIRWTSWTNRALFDARGKPLAYQSIGVDITDRKQADEALQVVSQLSKSIVDSSPIGISIYNSKGDCIAANDAAAEVIGTTKAQLLQQNYHQLDSWKKSGLYDAALRSIQENAKQHHEINMTTKFGKVCTLDIHLIPISLGNEPHLYIMLDDITERKLSEEKIANYGRIFENSLNEIYLFDTGTLKFTQVNYAAQQNLGYTLEELQKMTPLDINPEMRPALFSEQLAPLYNGEKAKIVFETRHKRKDQSLYDVEVHLQLLKYEHKAFFAAIISDITERKQAEEALRIERDKLKNIFEAMEDGVFIINQQYDIQFVNSAFTKEFGMYEGRKCYEYFHDLTETCPGCKSSNVLTAKTVHKEWYSPKNNKTYDQIDTPLKNPDGSISKLKISRDITERKQAEKELERHRDHLEETVKKRTAELQKTINAMSGREVRMAELKKENKKLQEQLENAGIVSPENK